METTPPDDAPITDEDVAAGLLILRKRGADGVLLPLPAQE
jgi:hypothetical protein